MATARVLVLGHSGTEGYGLGSRTAAWPELVRQHLEGEGTACELAASPLFPVGSRAVSYAIKQVERFQPDVVVVSLNAYPCSIAMVSAKVRRLFGNRAHGWFTRLERAFTRAVNPNAGTARRRMNRSARRLAHLVMGAEPIASVEEVASVYLAILKELARREGAQVVALNEVPFSRSIRSDSPGAYHAAMELQRRMEPAIREHRFVSVTPDGFEGGGPSEFWMLDGIHLSAAGNRAYAMSVVVALRSALSGDGDVPM